MATEDDQGFMRRALALAEHGRGRVTPNPLVGAVVVRDGEIVGEGWHLGPGTAHAEIRALHAAGDRARGATLYVTLEPCAHHGRTPPCAPAVLAAGVARVVAAIGDPFPAVDGKGFDVLRAGGVAVELGPGREEAEEQNLGFLHAVRHGRPHVTLKMAASLDGKVTARDGSSRWISGEASRARVHRMRAEADAIMAGAGTVLHDDPRLTARDPGYGGSPKLRVVVDGRGVVPATHRVFDGEAPTLVATTGRANPAVARAWSRAAEVLTFDDLAGRVPLDQLLKELGARDVQSVLLEGGPTLAADAVTRGLVDRVVVFLAPILIGGTAAPGLLGGEGVPTISEALPLSLRRMERFGDDVMVVADVGGFGGAARPVERSSRARPATEPPVMNGRGSS